MEKPILDVENLRIRYGGSPTEAVRGISFTLGRERLGIVGESGSGKTLATRALIALCCASCLRQRSPLTSWLSTGSIFSPSMRRRC